LDYKNVRRKYMTIKRIDVAQPTSNKISSLNDMILELDGNYAEGKFDKVELDQIFTDLSIDRKFLRNQGIGNTSLLYGNWSHVFNETGYSIWKYSPTNYKYNTSNQVYFDNKLVVNKGEATSEIATYFDYVYYDDGDSFTDYTVSAREEGTSYFTAPTSTGEYLYFGIAAGSFGGIKFEFYTRGSGYNLKVEYYNGVTWIALTANLNNLEDNTSNFLGDGTITWEIPGDWTDNVVNSVTAYWVRVSTITVPVTVASIYYSIPNSSVSGLLALSSREVLEETWKWCTYNGSIYITLRNSGDPAYEGDYYIKSSSSATLKENFFVYNHQVKADYEDITYSVTRITLDYLYDVSVVSGLANKNILAYDAADLTWRNQTFTELGLVSTTGTTGGAGSAGSGKQYVEMTVNGTVYKILHDGVVV
jgi:hypothetical protein